MTWAQLINTKEALVQSVKLQHTCKDHDFISFSIRSSKKIFICISFWGKMSLIFDNKLVLNDLLDTLQKKAQVY